MNGVDIDENYKHQITPRFHETIWLNIMKINRGIRFVNNPLEMSYRKSRRRGYTNYKSPD